jgi:hypothetical protein
MPMAPLVRMIPHYDENLLPTQLITGTTIGTTQCSKPAPRIERTRQRTDILSPFLIIVLIDRHQGQ